MSNAAANAEFYRESAARLDALWHELIAGPEVDETLTLALSAGVQALHSEARTWDKLAEIQAEIQAERAREATMYGGR